MNKPAEGSIEPKPRIHMRHGIWTCVSAWPLVIGCGYTPKGAYKEWERIREEQK